MMSFVLEQPTDIAICKYTSNRTIFIHYGNGTETEFGHFNDSVFQGCISHNYRIDSVPCFSNFYSHQAGISEKLFGTYGGEIVISESFQYFQRYGDRMHPDI